MDSNSESLGLIAGSHSLPLVLAREARAAGVQRLVAAAFTGETNPALAEVVDEIVWLKVGQLTKLIEAFASRGVNRCVMAGQISPKNLFDLRPDLRALGLLLRLKERNARTLFAGIADELQKEGIEMLDARPWLKGIIPESGYLIGPKLSRERHEDVLLGLRIARAVSALDIGQLVVVKKGTVLAVEAFEGTDACLKRGGELAGKDGAAVAVKVARQDHDFRFDIPCLGLKTVETCASSGIAVLAFVSGKTLLLDREQVEQAVVRSRMTWLTVE